MSESLRFVGARAFRQRIALSCISGLSIKIKDIRVRDISLPGLHPYEGDLIKLLDEISDGIDIQMDNKTFTELSLEPGILIGCEEGLVHRCHKSRGIGYYLEFLIMLGPFCKKGIDIILTGVTDHPDDPCIDTLRNGALLVLEKCGVAADFNIEIQKRGMLPEGGGRVRFTCASVKKISPFQLTYPGRVKSVKGFVWTCHMSPIFATRCLDAAKRLLGCVISHVEIAGDLCTGAKAGKSHGFGISLYAETMKGIVYTADGLVDKSDYAGRGKLKESKNPLGTKEKLQSKFLSKQKIQDLLSNQKTPEAATPETNPAEDLAETVVCKLFAEIAENGVTDTYFQWIPVFFMALSEEHAPSRVVLGRLTRNTVDLMQLMKEFFNFKFSLEPFELSARVSSSSTEHNADIKSGVDDDNDDDEAKELEIAFEEECHKIEKLRAHNLVVVSCVGLGLPNMARKTF